MAKLPGEYCACHLTVGPSNDSPNSIVFYLSALDSIGRWETWLASHVSRNARICASMSGSSWYFGYWYIMVSSSSARFGSGMISYTGGVSTRLSSFSSCCAGITSSGRTVLTSSVGGVGTRITCSVGFVGVVVFTTHVSGDKCLTFPQTNECTTPRVQCSGRMWSFDGDGGGQSVMGRVDDLEGGVTCGQ
mgnify:CR=1 FL=1